jgi:hypothetical protein
LASDFNKVNTGTYDIYFGKMPGANELGLLYNNETLMEVIDLGDIDTYTFIANVGETFDIQVTDISESGDLFPRIELYGPSGGNSLKYNKGEDIASIVHTSTEIGIYTVLVRDAGNSYYATGEYEISCVTDGDNDIDGEDLSQFAIDYSNGTYPYADVNDDGTIDDDDIVRFAREFGRP